MWNRWKNKGFVKCFGIWPGLQIEEIKILQTLAGNFKLQTLVGTYYSVLLYKQL